jgi:hypothetical protein
VGVTAIFIVGASGEATGEERAYEGWLREAVDSVLSDRINRTAHVYVNDHWLGASDDWRTRAIPRLVCPLLAETDAPTKGHPLPYVLVLRRDAGPPSGLEEIGHGEITDCAPGEERRPPRRDAPPPVPDRALQWTERRGDEHDTEQGPAGETA